MKKCPRCGNNKFYITAHVTQDWVVDENGNFLETYNDCIDVLHYPDDEDLWQCTECGFEAEGEEFEIKEDSELPQTTQSDLEPSRV